MRNERNVRLTYMQVDLILTRQAERGEKESERADIVGLSEERKKERRGRFDIVPAYAVKEEESQIRRDECDEKIPTLLSSQSRVMR